MASESTPEVLLQNDGDYDDEMQEMAFAKRGCCFCIPCFSSERSTGSLWWERITTAEKEEKWWAKGLTKMRGWSELVAGPRWKTFIRRFNKNRNSGRSNSKFQYDPLSYALNFDEGPGQNGNSDCDYPVCDFSTRLASITTSSVNPVKEDGPSSLT
ncbi:uncharacterized protein LOC132267603 [Cornus florida]|uniref:uncharacterized protein LOC132267603 n=1 Tax=Cornus florida TaxID=4283 RepID=UPI00289EB25D|nr:uncharacterized protein LOC132267603 [Cornus florida]